MLNIEKKKKKISDKLKRKIEMIGRFTNTTPIINNGSIKNITGTNVAYIMPHIIVIKNNKYLIFDECDDVYINTYFRSHPEMVMGEFVETTNQFGKDVDVKLDAGANLDEMLTEAINKLPLNVYKNIENF